MEERRKLFSLAGYGDIDDQRLDSLESIGEIKEKQPVKIWENLINASQEVDKAKPGSLKALTRKSQGHYYPVYFRYEPFSNAEEVETSFGAEIKKLRLSTGQSQGTLAKLSQISSAQWSRIENDKRHRPGLLTVLKMMFGIRQFKNVPEVERIRLLSIAGFKSVSKDVVDKFDLVIAHPPFTAEDNIQNDRHKQAIKLIDGIFENQFLNEQEKNSLANLIEDVIRHFIDERSSFLPEKKTV